MNISINPAKIAKLLVIIIIVLTIMSLTGQFYKYLLNEGQDRYITSMFFLDSEFNIPTWYAAITILICSMLTAITYLLVKSEINPFKLHWLGLSVIFFVLASDEMLVFHEQSITPLRNLLGTSGFLYLAWIIPAGILLVIFFFTYYKFLFSLPANTRTKFIIAGIIYVTGAVVMEAIGSKILSDQGQNNLFYAIITNIEELLEMVGIVLFIYAILEYLSHYYSKITFSILDNK